MQRLCFTGNLRHRLARIKEFQPLEDQVEVVMDHWLKRFCQGWLEEEFVLQCGAERYERTPHREDVRHSPYPRRLVTSRGSVTLHVPRGRYGRYVYALFDRYRRYTPAFEAAVVESVLAGRSTRQARTFFHKLWGKDTFSQQTASRLLKRFDAELKAWRQRSLPQGLKLLVLDAVHLKGAQITSRKARPLLVALGVHADGRQEILDFTVAWNESQIAWERFSQRLLNRRLEKVDLVVHDDHASIHAAVALCWPEALDQLCVFHVLKNLQKALGRKDKVRRQLLRHARWLYEAQSLEEFHRWSQKFRKRWRSLRHPAVERFMDHWPETTCYFALDRKWWRAAKTSNLLERYFEEVRRRIRVFRRPPNNRSCERWFYALIARFNHNQTRIPGFQENESHQFT